MGERQRETERKRKRGKGERDRQRLSVAPSLQTLLLCHQAPGDGGLSVGLSGWPSLNGVLMEG